MTGRPAALLTLALGVAAALPATADAAGPGAGTALSAARAVHYAAVGGVVGLLVLLHVVWRPLRNAGTVDPDADAAFASRAGGVLRAAAVGGVLATLTALALQGAVDDGAGIADALRPRSVADAVGTRRGLWLLISALAFAVLARAAGRVVRAGGPRAPGGRPTVVAALAGGLLVIAPAVGGNAAAESPAWALVPIQVVHVAGMGSWFGGLLALAIVVPVALRTRPEGRSRTALLAAVVLRFSPVALVAVAVLTAAGTALALLHLTTLYDLTDTAYGRAVVAKAALLVVAIVVAVGQREVLLPRLRRLADGGTPAPATDDDDAPAAPPAATPEHVRAALRAEASLLAAVLVVTGALTGYPLPRALDTGAAEVARSAGSVQLRATVRPARVGRNDVAVRVLDRAGRPVAGARDLQVRAVPPGRSGGSDVPVDVPVTPGGPGRWRGRGVALGTRGGWTLEASVALPGAGRVAAELPVRIR